jgi:hypothetical protein
MLCRQTWSARRRLLGGCAPRAPRRAKGSLHACAILAGEAAGYTDLASAKIACYQSSRDPFLVSCAPTPSPHPTPTAPPLCLTVLCAHAPGRTGNRIATGCAKWRTIWAKSGRLRRPFPFPSYLARCSRALLRSHALSCSSIALLRAHCIVFRCKCASELVITEPPVPAILPHTLFRSARSVPQDEENPLLYVGDEWSDRRSLDQVLEDFVEPFCAAGAVAGEIGCMCLAESVVVSSNSIYIELKSG